MKSFIRWQNILFLKKELRMNIVFFFIKQTKVEIYLCAVLIQVRNHRWIIAINWKIKIKIKNQNSKFHFSYLHLVHLVQLQLPIIPKYLKKWIIKTTNHINKNVFFYRWFVFVTFEKIEKIQLAFQQRFQHLCSMIFVEKNKRILCLYFCWQLLANQYQVDKLQSSKTQTQNQEISKITNNDIYIYIYMFTGYPLLGGFWGMTEGRHRTRSIVYCGLWIKIMTTRKRNLKIFVITRKLRWPTKQFLRNIY